MFDAICIRRQQVTGTPIDLGFLAEAMLFYQNVRVVADDAIFSHLLRVCGPDSLIAGLIINAFEYVLNGVVLAKDMEAATNALGRHVGGPELFMFTTWAFLVGIIAVWLYAAIRPRYGAGPKAAVCAAIAVW